MTTPATTIEQTSKTWKLIQLVGFLALIGGVALACWAWERPLPGETNLAFGLGCMTAASGLALNVLGSVGAWWYHG